VSQWSGQRVIRGRPRGDPSLVGHRSQRNVSPRSSRRGEGRFPGGPADGLFVGHGTDERTESAMNWPAMPSDPAQGPTLPADASVLTCEVVPFLVDRRHPSPNREVSLLWWRQSSMGSSWSSLREGGSM